MANKNNAKAKDIALRLDYEFYNHKGKWLDREAVTFYRKQMQDIYDDGQNNGKFRALREEMQKEYGLTEIETTNLLRGFHTGDYLLKYDRIKNMTPYREELESVDGDINLIMEEMSKLTRADRIAYRKKRMKG